MTPDRNQLKTLLTKVKSSELLTLPLDSIDKNSYKNYQIEIDKFIKKSEDYVIIVIKR